METREFDYDLPAELIAQRPAKKRDESRLLSLPRGTGPIGHLHFFDLPKLLRRGDVLVLNDVKVIPARITAHRPTGGKIEITLIARMAGERELWRCLAKPGRRMRSGEALTVSESLKVTPVQKEEDGSWVVELEAEGDVMKALDKAGRAPLPPYIRRAEEDGLEEDRERYQTVYAEHPGAVAAPTAGLHFTPGLMKEIEKAGAQFARVTLEVGWGSFAPVREERVEDHKVAPEKFRVTEECANVVNAAKKSGGRIIAVGTTSVRVLESAWTPEGLKPAEEATELFITPGYRFKAIDGMITNFHLPRSSLIMLVAAFVGLERLLDAYKEAIRLNYRFYSYGDSMVIS